jgi:hypothetical protein
MGSDGSNGIDSEERGGAWLYFHNNGAPESRGSRSSAARGLLNFERGSVCANTSTANLSTGEIIPPSGNYSNASPGSDNSSGQYYNSNGLNPVGSGIDAGGLNNEGEAASQEDDPRNQDDEFVRKIIDSCQRTVSQSCPNVEEAVIREYCANQEAFKRGSCQFERVDGQYDDEVQRENTSE